MRRVRRFAAPLVIVTACGGRPPPEAFEHPTARWSIERDEGDCYASEHDECDDSEHTCNPPSPPRVRCVYGDDELVEQVDGACWAGSPPREVPCPPEVELPEPTPPPHEPAQPHPPWLDKGPI